MTANIDYSMWKFIPNSKLDNKLLQCACSRGYTEIVELILENKSVNPADQDNILIRLACQHGYANIMRILLADFRVDPAVDNNILIRIAMKYPEIVKMLLTDPRVNPTNKLFRDACRFGYAETVRVLLSDPRVDPTDMDNEAIMSAIICGHFQVVVELLADPRTKLEVFGIRALRLAFAKNHHTIANLLLAKLGVKNFNRIHDVLENVLEYNRLTDGDGCGEIENLIKSNFNQNKSDSQAHDTVLDLGQPDSQIIEKVAARGADRLNEKLFAPGLVQNQSDTQSNKKIFAPCLNSNAQSQSDSENTWFAPCLTANIPSKVIKVNKEAFTPCSDESNHRSSVSVVTHVDKEILQVDRKKSATMFTSTNLIQDAMAQNSVQVITFLYKRYTEELAPLKSINIDWACAQGHLDILELILGK